MDNTLRWQQRFENFEKSYLTLVELEKAHTQAPTQMLKLALVKAYGATLRLSWKLLKDYLTEEGYDIATPREAFVKAFQAELITQPEAWLQALAKRDLGLDAYKEAVLEEGATFILDTFYPLARDLYHYFKKLLP